MPNFNKLPGKEKIQYIIFFSIPLISFLMIEFAARGSFISIFTWLVNEPIQFLLSLVLFYAIYVFLWANINHRGAVALIFSIFGIIVAAVVGCKREILGIPLMPWDLLLSSDLTGLFEDVGISQYNFLSNGLFILVLSINIVIIALIFIFQKAKYLNKRASIISPIICFIVVAAIILTLPKADISETATICEEEGYIRGFIVSAQIWSEMNSSKVAMAGSSDANINFTYDFTSKEATTDINPNVVFIMSEAFWDVTLLPNVTFSEDPIPTFHALAKEGISGEMVSPTYGGVTDNTEFEVMTGFSLKYLPYQTNAYTTSIKKAIPALPSYFKSLGYQTIAVHPNVGSFFNRDVVYPLLGIDRFFTQAYMKDAKIKGAYISDDSFANYIISEYKQAKKPVFMYNISIQNHWPYTKENYYEDYDITIKSKKNLDKESMTALQNYTQGLHDADASLKKVIDYFRTVDEPTVIIFLGDHLPALTDQLGVYKKLGYIDKSISDSDLYKGIQGANISNQTMFIQSQKILKTPYLIWFNYKTDIEKGETLSANYLGIYTISKLGIELPPFYNFLLDYSTKVPVNRYYLSIDASGMPFIETPSIYANYEKIYNKVQNDMMFGDQNEKNLFTVK